MKCRRWRLCAGDGVRGPDVVVSEISCAARLTQQKILVTRVVNEYVKWTGGRAIEPCMEKMALRAIVLFEKYAEGMIRIETLERSLPGGEEGSVRRGSDVRALELGKQILRGVVGESKISREELLIQDGSAQKAGKLLFFRGIARKRECMPQPRKNETGNATFVGLKEDKLSLGEVQGNVGLMYLDAILGGNNVDRLRIEAKGVEGCQSIARRVSGPRRQRKKKEKYEDGAKPHEESVVIFGIREQG